MERKENVLAVIDGKTYRLPEHEEEFALIERKEDELIVREMTGEIIDSYFYRFNSKGAEVVELNARGIFEVAQMYGGIRCTTRLDDGAGPNYVVTASALDKVRDVEFDGGAEQAKRLANGSEDIFAFAKAVTKSQRNALKKVLPYSLVRKLLLNFLAASAEQELIAVRETALQRISEYGYSVELFNEFCVQKFGAEFCELDIEKAKKAAAFIVTAQAKSNLRGE